MHQTDLPKWVGRDAIALFAKEMGLTEDELNRLEWTDTEDFIDPKDKTINWEKMTVGNWWVTVDLKAYLVWIAFTDPNNTDSDTYLWQQLCQGCCQTRDSFSTSDVELQDGRTVKLPLCNKICAPDWWDDGPGEWIRLEEAHLPDDGEKPEVRLKHWMCEHCSSVYDYDMVELRLDSDYDPPSKAIVCLFCQSKEPERFLELS